MTRRAFYVALAGVLILPFAMVLISDTIAGSAVGLRWVSDRLAEMMLSLR